MVPRVLYKKPNLTANTKAPPGRFAPQVGMQVHLVQRGGCPCARQLAMARGKEGKEGKVKEGKDGKRGGIASRHDYG